MRLTHHSCLRTAARSEKRRLEITLFGEPAVEAEIEALRDELGRRR